MRSLGVHTHVRSHARLLGGGLKPPTGTTIGRAPASSSKGMGPSSKALRSPVCGPHAAAHFRGGSLSGVPVKKPLTREVKPDMPIPPARSQRRPGVNTGPRGGGIPALRLSPYWQVHVYTTAFFQNLKYILLLLPSTLHQRPNWKFLRTAPSGDGGERGPEDIPPGGTPKPPGLGVSTAGGCHVWNEPLTQSS